MTETLTPPTVVVGADSPLALLFDIALEIGTQGEDEQREDAKTAALDHVSSHYPDTLGKAVDEDDWTGRPALPKAGLEPCAVACLDGGWWLHYITDGDQESDVLTLIAPCTCGNGNIDTALDGECDLLEVLNDLRATGGRFPHHSDRPDCTSQHACVPGATPGRDNATGRLARSYRASGPNSPSPSARSWELQHRPALDVPQGRTPRMTTVMAPASLIDKNLDTACASVASEISRTDGKASLLPAFNGALLTGLASSQMGTCRSCRTTWSPERRERPSRPPCSPCAPAGFRRRNWRSRGAAGGVLS